MCIRGSTSLWIALQVTFPHCSLSVCRPTTSARMPLAASRRTSARIRHSRPAVPSRRRRSSLRASRQTCCTAKWSSPSSTRRTSRASWRRCPSRSSALPRMLSCNIRAAYLPLQTRHCSLAQQVGSLLLSGWFLRRVDAGIPAMMELERRRLREVSAGRTPVGLGQACKLQAWFTFPTTNFADPFRRRRC
jgi:hypothetical protein